MMSGNGSSGTPGTWAARATWAALTSATFLVSSSSSSTACQLSSMALLLARRVQLLPLLPLAAVGMFLVHHSTHCDGSFDAGVCAYRPSWKLPLGRSWP